LPESLSRTRFLEKTSIVTVIQALILVLLSCAAYFNALSGEFVFDDTLQVVDNPWLRDIGNIFAIFSKSVWSFQLDNSTSNYYRPLMHIAYMLTYHLFGLKPLCFHVVNLVFHCGVSVLVFLIIKRLLTDHSVRTSSAYFSPPFIAAMLFASHPIHTEAVTWIAGLPDVAFSFFYLLSFYFYISFRNGVKRAYLLSLLSFLAATLFKEPALTLPIMLVAYDYLLGRLNENVIAGVKIYMPYIAVSSGYLLARYFALRSLVPMEFYPSLSNFQLVINVFPLFREYLTSLLWPFNLNLWHTFHPISSPFEENGIISMVVIGIYIIVTALAYRRNKIVLFGLLSIVVPLLPAFYIKGISGKPFAERYLYLPSLGYVLLLSLFLSWAREKLPRAIMATTIIFVLIVGSYTFATINRNSVWKDDYSLWADTVKKSPDGAGAHLNFAHANLSMGQVDTAIAEYQMALRLDPYLSKAHNGLGVAYKSKGSLDMAISEYKNALRIDPYYADAHGNLGNVYSSKGLRDMAISEYQLAVRLKPGSAKIHYNLADEYFSAGLTDMAISEYQTTLHLNPDYAEPHYNLAVIYFQRGDTDMAKKELERALYIRPQLNEARRLLQNILSNRR